MNAKLIQITGLVLTVSYGLFVVWIYWAAPKDLLDATIKARETVESATEKTKVATNLYQIDKEKFDQGLAAFRADRFVAARDLFERADPERRNAEVQYYIAYSLYRQGWGRFSHNDELFEIALEQVRFVRRLDPDFRSKDTGLALKLPAELEAEITEGLRVTASDFNPLRAFGERK